VTAVVGLAGYSGSGKTTLICKLIPVFQSKGKRVAVIKHDAHGHYKEAEGKDTGSYREAGASAFVAVSPHSYTRFEQGKLDLQGAIKMLPDYDLILVEGYKNESHPKIAVIRKPEQEDILDALQQPPIAVVSAIPLKQDTNVPMFALDDAEGIAEWLERYMATMEKEN